MANTIDFILTNAASELISKVLGGKTLKFTRMAVGDGFSYDTTIAKGYKTLVNEVLSIDITKSETLSASSVKVTSAFKNTDAQKEFYYREVGLYAQDPDTGEEILYAYGNRNDAAERITPTGSSVITKQLAFIISVGDSANVTFKVNAGVYALQEDMTTLQATLHELNSTKANQSKQNELEARMNTFVAVGSTSDNAETTDIRVDSDGIIHGSAGESVREEVSTVKKGVINYETELSNIFGNELSATIGALGTDGGYNESITYSILINKPVYVIKGSKIGVKSGYKFQVCEYEGEKVSSFRRYSGVLTSNDTYIVSKNGYIRVAVRHEDTSLQADVSIFGNLILNVAIGYIGLQNKLDIENIKVDVSNVSDELYDKTSIAAPISSFVFDLYALNSGGTLVASTNRVATKNFTYVKKGSKVSVTSNDFKFNLCTYSDANKESVINFYPFAIGDNPVVIQQDCYIRFGIAYVDDRVLEDTSISNNFKLNIIIGEIKEQDTEMKSELKIIKDTIGDVTQHPYFIATDIPMEHYTPKSKETFNLFNYESSVTSYASFINAYMALFNGNENFATTTILGKDSSNTYDIYKFDLKQTEYNTSYTSKTKPKIVIAAGLHGFEKASMYALYCFTRELIKEWKNSCVLEYLRFNCDFSIIPVANPWGFERNSYLNAHGVNINRNFSYKWDESATGTDYAGTKQFSELETQYIKKLIDDNKTQLFFIDFHTTGSNTDVEHCGFYNWISDGCDDFPNEKKIILNKKHIEKMTRHLPDNYDLTIGSTEFVGRMTHAISSGISQGYANSVGLNAVTFEIAPKFFGQDAYNNNIIKAGVELIGNYIIDVIRMYHNIIIK